MLLRRGHGDAAELIATRRSEVQSGRGADSLGYLSSRIGARGNIPSQVFCLACFTGDYPIPVQLELDKFSFERGGREALPSARA